MKRLLLDTSSEYLSFLLANDNQLLSFNKYYADRFISERVLVEYDNILKSASIRSTDIDEFIVVVGPGSFTGVRLGVAFILGLQAATGKQAFGITSLDALALSTPTGKFSTVARVKDSSFAKRDYNFENNIFTNIELVDENDFNGQNISSVNSFKEDRLSLDKFYMNIERYRFLLCKSEPLYLRKAEAELSFDKKSNTI